MSRLLTVTKPLSKRGCILWFCLAGCLFLTRAQAQQLSTYQAAELGFAHYLLQQKQYTEAIQVLQAMPAAGQALHDTVALLMGQAYFQQRQLDSAAFFLQQVSAQASTFPKARFQATVALANLGRYREGEAVLAPQRFPEQPLLQQMRLLELGGLALLQHRYTRFDSLKAGFTREHYQLAEHQQHLTDLAGHLQQVRKKSPLAAGLMSAVLPGSGKVYAGKLGGGIAAFLATGIMGAQAYEGYRKGGTRDAQFLVFGSLFTIFYMGNIWGSALAVRVARQEQYQAIHEQILLDMHIPLRVIFD